MFPPAGKFDSITIVLQTALGPSGIDLEKHFAGDFVGDEKCPLRPEEHGAERPLQNLIASEQLVL